MNYEEFIKTKKKEITQSGFEIRQDELNNFLFPFQKKVVYDALKKGKFSIFADCGLGKTLMQLEWANQIVNFTKKPVLILAPLAVSAQTIMEGTKFGISCVKYYDQTKAGVYITNYEQLNNIDTSIFSGIVLDESSILKNFSGKLRNLIIDKFSNTQFKLACTATPSPNDPMELGNHADFLDVMKRNEMLAMYFVHDGGSTQKWRLKGHAINEFYKFISTWAIMFNKPSDIGFKMEGYNLPELHIEEFKIKTDKKDNGLLFNEVAVSATKFNQELRDTMDKRLSKVADIVNNSNENFIIWIKQNKEGDLIKKLIHDAVEVRGSDKPEDKERKLLGFANNEFRVLVTKTKIAQFGMNFQNCHNQIFASLDFSFESLYQAIRRSYRFRQLHPVFIKIITTDTMQNVIEIIKDKQQKFIEMQEKLSNIMNDNSIINEKCLNEDFKTDIVDIKNGDCVSLIKNIADESVGLGVFSPPFADLYTYSNNIEDMGNSRDYKEFLTHFDFLIKELYRVVKQGRNVCVHCMDLPIQKGKDGFIGLRDFSGMILKSFNDAGFIYHSRITIWKNPVVEMQRTKSLGLLHKQLRKDSTMSRVGIPDYIMVFRKDGERLDPVVNDKISVDKWQKLASPVWMDIDYGNTLQGYKQKRNEKDEKHIAPLQLDTIERLITLYSNEGDTVLTPFMGIGSEIYKALEMNRKGIGFELKKEYFNISVENIKSILEKKNQMQLSF